MEPLPSKFVKTTARTLAGLLIAGLVSTGCVPLLKLPTKTGAETAEQTASAKDRLPPANLFVEAMWQNKVMLVPDIISGGRPMPGLSGRIYLFGPERGTPVVREGELIVKLYDATDTEDPKEMEVWHIDPVSLRGLVKQDILGPGYTVFLPWGRYSPTVQRVNMQVIFVPTGKQSIMHQSGTLTIDHTLVQERDRLREMPSNVTK